MQLARIAPTSILRKSFPVHLLAITPSVHPVPTPGLTVFSRFIHDAAVIPRITAMRRNGIGSALLFALIATTSSPAAVVLNDIHSRLNQTRVAEYHEPESKDEIAALVRKAAQSGQAISISGGRHAMGGQQFGQDTLHINLSRFSKVHDLDRERGWVTVDSGIQWPELIDWLLSEQQGEPNAWGIRQKQTGADKLSIGGALSANAHSRGLTMQPIVGDVESFS
jgi:hypothetical protein